MSTPNLHLMSAALPSAAGYMNSPLKSFIIVFIPRSRVGSVGSFLSSIRTSESQSAFPILKRNFRALVAIITPPPTPPNAHPSVS